METETKDKRTKEDVERALNVKKDQIEQRLAALQEEVSTVGPSIQDAIFNHPLVSVGGALLAGLVVGLLFGGKKRKQDAFGAGADHRALVDHYVGAVVEEARHRMAGGQDAEEAVRAALHERVPLIVYEVPEASSASSMTTLAKYFVLRQLVPLGIQMGLNFLKEGVGDEAPGEG